MASRSDVARRGAGEWDFYFAQVNDAPGSVFLDLSAAHDCPDPELPWLISVFLHLRAPRPDGLVSDEEAPVLAELEAKLVKALSRRLSARFVGRVTGCGRRDFFFYAPSVFDLDETIASALVGFEGHERAQESREDPDWDHYQDVLFPSVEELQWISDRHAIEELRARGDSVYEPRPVEHALGFKTKAGRARFEKQVAKLGFEVGAEAVDQDEEDEDPHPYKVEIARRDAVNLDAIHEVVLDLMRRAGRCGGEHEGWDTSVVRARKTRARAKAKAKKRAGGRKARG